MVARRSFLKLGLSAAVGAIASKAALSFANKDGLTPKNHLIPEEMDVPAIVPVKKERTTVYAKIGKGQDFETLQEFFDYIPADLTNSNTKYIGEIYDNRVFTPNVLKLRGTSNSPVIIRPAPGKGYVATISKDKARDIKQKRTLLAEMISSIA